MTIAWTVTHLSLAEGLGVSGIADEAAGQEGGALMMVVRSKGRRIETCVSALAFLECQPSLCRSRPSEISQLSIDRPSHEILSTFNKTYQRVL